MLTPKLSIHFLQTAYLIFFDLIRPTQAPLFFAFTFPPSLLSYVRGGLWSLWPSAVFLKRGEWWDLRSDLTIIALVLFELCFSFPHRDPLWTNKLISNIFTEDSKLMDSEIWSAGDFVSCHHPPAPPLSFLSLFHVNLDAARPSCRTTKILRPVCLFLIRFLPAWRHGAFSL